MNEAKTQIHLADEAKRVAQWRKTFDHVYRFPPGSYAPTFVGWTSSYTNKPLPEIEMREWLDCTVDRIMSLRPAKVLEIGCGVGLLVEKLAPKCSHYRGIDQSLVAIGRLREFVASRRELHHVELAQCAATDLDDQALGSVDTVVINSVVQYFPDINYLRAVLQQAARVVSSGGRIFIGDVRHFGLLSLFHSAVQLAKAPPAASARWLKRKVSLAIEQERELVIDPQFFLDLPNLIPRICGVEILLKRGRLHNELTRYRYDVVLHVGETGSSPPLPNVELHGGEQPVAELVSRFDAQQLTSTIIMDVPNRRLAGDIASMRRLWSADDRQLVEDIRLPMSADPDFGSDPEDFWELSETRHHDVRVGWSPHSANGSFDVLLASRDRSPGALSLGRTTKIAAASNRQPQATDPLEAGFMQQLGLELQKRLRDRRPELQLPSVVLAVKALPSSEPGILGLAVQSAR